MGVILPNSDGGGSTGQTPPSGTPAGGGSSGSGSGGASTNPSINLANLPVTGGLIGYQINLLFPLFDTVTKSNMIYVMDSNNFNTEEDVEYDFKVEEFEPGNEATVHRVLIRYRDLGQVTFTLAVVSADKSNVDTTKGSGNAQIITVGNNGPNGTPTGKIHTFKASVKVTTEAPQVKIFRSALDGPLAIMKVKAWASYGDGDII
jgi:tripartite-type tricarboxylate transporter receptor subunit TctC